MGSGGCTYGSRGSYYQVGNGDGGGGAQLGMMKGTVGLSLQDEVCVFRLGLWLRIVMYELGNFQLWDVLADL